MTNALCTVSPRRDYSSPHLIFFFLDVVYMTFSFRSLKKKRFTI